MRVESGFPGSFFVGPGKRRRSRRPGWRKGIGACVARQPVIVIAEIQCLASPAGTPEDPYKHIDAAIKIVQDSGLKYEVGALGTTMEGEPDRVWLVLRQVHEACIAAGANGLVSVIKVEQAAPARVAPTIDSLTGKFRG